MSLKTMYAPQKDSPSTFLLGDISTTDTLITVASAASLPQTMPYPLTLGIDKAITETVIVTATNLGNNQLTVTRGTPAYTWLAGTKVARVLTAKDIKDMQDNIVSNGAGVDDLYNTVTNIQGPDISTLKNTVGSSGSGLVKGLADENTRARAAETAEASRAGTAEANLTTTKVNRTELAQVITDWTYSADGTKLLVTITRYNASTQQTTQYTKTIPIVSNAAIGVMTPEAYNEITALRTDVNSLINLGGRFIGVSFATKAALTAYVVPASVKTGDFTYVIDDETKNGSTTRYVRNGTTWDFTFVIEYDPIGLANTSTPGIVKSTSGVNGKVFVETDGTLSVVGWDATQTIINNKLDKSSSDAVVYANDDAGLPTVIDIGEHSATAGTIPIRTTGGQIITGAPVDSNAATPKNYVDPFNTAPTAGGTATALTVSSTSFLLVQGGKLTFIAAADNGEVATTINGKPLYKPNTILAPKLVAGNMYNVWYDTASGGRFFLKASAASAVGTAVVGDVLAGKTFSNGIATALNGALNVGEGSYSPEPMSPFLIRTTPNSNEFRSICYGMGIFVAVSASGTGNRVISSPDGVTWTARTSAADNNWRGVCYGNGLFVAVAVTGTGNRVMTSPDGITWTIRTSAADSDWYSVCYGNGLFVAVAASGTAANRVMTSPDGITWTLRTAASVNNWHSVCFGNNLFVAVANTGTGDRVMTSPDGITWTTRVSPADNAWYTVCYGNGLFVAVAASNLVNCVMTSPDGITWSTQTCPINHCWWGVCYGNGLFVAVADSSYSGSGVMTSPDGITWSMRASTAANNNNDWMYVCYGIGMFVAVAYANGGNGAMTMNYSLEEVVDKRPTGLLALNAFTLNSSTTKKYYNAVCYANGRFVAVGSSSNMVSFDGITWTVYTPPVSNDWHSICYGKGLFVTVSRDGTGNHVMTSPDGFTWTSRTSAADNYWRSVCYGNGLFVAVASSGTGNRVMTSPDGITWTSRAAAADNDWMSVCYANGLFVAVAMTGTGNRVMTSPDGITWTIRTSAADNYWKGVCYGDGLFVAVAGASSGNGTRVMTSPDGIKWTTRVNSADNDWYAVCYGNGMFVAVATYATASGIMTSPDGITWTTRVPPSDGAWGSVCYANGMFVALDAAAAGAGAVMTSCITRQQIDGAVSKSILDLGVVTGVYSSATVVTFNLKTLVSDASIFKAENIILQFTVQSTLAISGSILTLSYVQSTGVLTCTASSSLFASGTVKARICVIM